MDYKTLSEIATNFRYGKMPDKNKFLTYHERIIIQQNLDKLSLKGTPRSFTIR